MKSKILFEARAFVLVAAAAFAANAWAESPLASKFEVMNCGNDPYGTGAGVPDQVSGSCGTVLLAYGDICGMQKGWEETRKCADAVSRKGSSLSEVSSKCDQLRSRFQQIVTRIDQGINDCQLLTETQSEHYGRAKQRLLAAVKEIDDAVNRRSPPKLPEHSETPKTPCRAALDQIKEGVDSFVKYKKDEPGLFSFAKDVEKIITPLYVPHGNRDIDLRSCQSTLRKIDAKANVVLGSDDNDQAADSYAKSVHDVIQTLGISENSGSTTSKAAAASVSQPH